MSNSKQTSVTKYLQHNNNASFPSTRLRRLRQHPQLRNLVRETQLSINDFILPLFIHEGLDKKRAVSSMPGQFQLSLNDLDQEINEIVELGIGSIMLFGIPNHKDGHGSESQNTDGIIQRAIRQIKSQAPQLLISVDNCFCEYTDHGHCGVVQQRGEDYHIDNDATLKLLVQQSISYAQAGADLLAPSGMMDGTVAAIRHGLDQEGFHNLPVMVHAAKYASSFYGPFREAAEGSPQFGDRKTYQMDPANSNEALREIELDINEGADIIMIKPALAYLDIIARAKQHFPQVPIAAYQVSGEYSMIKAAAQMDWLDEKKVMLESVTAIKRAGASIIVSYFTKDIARLL